MLALALSFFLPIEWRYKCLCLDSENCFVGTWSKQELNKRQSSQWIEFSSYYYIKIQFFKNKIQCIATQRCEKWKLEWSSIIFYQFIPTRNIIFPYQCHYQEVFGSNEGKKTEEWPSCGTAGAGVTATDKWYFLKLDRVGPVDIRPSTD